AICYMNAKHICSCNESLFKAIREVKENKVTKRHPGVSGLSSTSQKSTATKKPSKRLHQTPEATTTFHLKMMFQMSSIQRGKRLFREFLDGT
ncbi:hypothetical protein L9F63_013511, partial [Diploptera punctata]